MRWSGSCLPTRSARIAAACGTLRRKTGWTRIDSGAIWAVWLKPTRKSRGGWAFLWRMVRSSRRGLCWCAPTELENTHHHEGMGPMKARVTVTLKSGVLDPQGKAIANALAALGIPGVDDVRQGK